MNDPLSHPDLAETVRRLLADVKSRRVFVSISSSEVLLKWIQLPDAVPQAAAELQNLAIETALDSGDYIPVSLDSAAYDFHLMTAGTLLVGWMRREKLASLYEQLADVELVYLTPQSVTLANQLLSEGSERVCGVHVDGDFCDLVVVEAGSTDRTGRPIGAQLCMGRSFFVENPTQLERTVRQSLANCPNPTGAALQRIVLLGNASESISEQLIERLGVAVTESTFDWHTALLKPIRSPVASDRWSAKRKSKTSRRRRVTGAASGHWIRLNLLARALAENALRRKSRRKRLLMRRMPIAILILLLGANAKLFEATESKRERIAALRLDRAREKTLRAETESLQKRHAEIEDALAPLAWGERRFPPLARRLALIADLCPAAVRLTEIRTVPPPKTATDRDSHDARRVLLAIGIAPTQAEINAFRVALVTQTQFSSVRQVKTEQTTIADEKWLEFTLALESGDKSSGQ